MLPDGAKEAALQAASAWTCSRCQARRKSSRSKQPDCSTCTTVRFYRPNQPETSRKSAHCNNRP
jgi:hypothetical protein